MREDKKFLLALVFVIVVAIALISETVASALIAVGVALVVSMCAFGAPPVEGFYAPPPGAPAPYLVSAGVAGGRQPPEPRAPRHDRGRSYKGMSRYPGSIDDQDEYETENGHRDRDEGDGEVAPEGNPYNVGRVAAPEAAGPDLDDEANDENIDGDERMNYQMRSRNDPTRVEAGIYNRTKDLKKYLNEELAEAEERQWWGRHEV